MSWGTRRYLGVLDILRGPTQSAMSWSELERLVDQAEAQPSLRRSLKECCLAPELILAARSLGDRITSNDLLDFLVKTCRPYWGYGI
ncbi:MAG: hypothetical protein RLZZ274_2000 [Cyanobacteriota bacterium]